MFLSNFDNINTLMIIVKEKSGNTGKTWEQIYREEIYSKNHNIVDETCIYTHKIQIQHSLMPRWML